MDDFLQGNKNCVLKFDRLDDSGYTYTVYTLGYVMTISTLSSSINAVDQEQKAQILVTFVDVVKGMDDKQKDIFADRILAESKRIKDSIVLDSPEVAEQILRDTQKWEAFTATLNAEKTEARKSQDDEVARLKALLAGKDNELAKANKTIKSNDKDMQAMTTLEFGPKNIAKLLLLKRQQDKMDYFLKKDPMAGMVYIYNSGMIGVRHLKRAVHGKKFIFGLLTFKEDPRQVKAQFQEYIAKLKESATTPKQQVVVRQLAEKIQLINDKYVDLYNKNNGPKKFNS